MVDDFYENLTALTDNLSDIVFSRYAEVTKVDGYSCECKENESGVVHIDVPIINNFEVEVGDFIILGFVDNDLYNPVAIGMLEPRGGGGGDVPIVTAWEQTLSDSKVPSEKLTKDTIDTKVDKETGKGLSTEDYTTSEKTKLAGIEAEANKTVVDGSLSDTSTNPVQNNVVKSALDDKVDPIDLATVATTGDYDDLTDKPSIPSNTSDLTNDGDGTNPFLTQHQSLSGYLKTTDIVDDLTTADPDKPLSAKQGKILKDLIDSLMPTVANVVLTSDKSILSAFDSESATLTATVTNSQSAPVASETVTFYKGSTVLGTATTNSSGVASLTYNSAGAGVLSVTATAEDVTSSSVTLEDCYRYDDCTSDKSSTYSPIQLDTRDVVPSFSFSTDHYTLSSSKDCFSGFKPVDVNDNVEFSAEVKVSGTTVYLQSLLGYFNDDTVYGIRLRGDKKVDYYTRKYSTGSETFSTFYTSSTYFNTNYYRIKMKKEGTSLTISIETLEGTQLGTSTQTITSSANDKLFFGFLSGTGRDVYIKNIKVLKI